MSTGTLLAQHHQAKHLVGESVFRKPDVLNQKNMSCFRNHRLNLLAALDFVSPSLPVRFIEVLRCLPRGFFSRPRCLPTPCGQAPSGLPHSRSEHCQGSHGWKIGRWRGVGGKETHLLHISTSNSILVGFSGYTISHEIAMCYACFRFDVFNPSPSALANVGEAPAAEEFVASAVWSLRERGPGTVGIRWFWKDLGWFI